MRTILIIFCFMALFNSCANSQEIKENNTRLEQILKNRRSIRSYTGNSINHDTLQRIVKAGAFAPSSYGQNPVEFVVVEDKAELAAVARAKRIGAPSVREAAAAIVVIADTSKGELWIEDASVAAGYILLAAEDLGIGACWNQIRDRDGQRLSASDEIKQILGIPSQYEVLCVIALGHKAENKAARTEREMKVQQRTHFEKF